MPDIHVFDFRPAIDQHGPWRLLQKLVGGAGIKMLHRHIRQSGSADIMEADQQTRKLAA
jgi:hypothetical protein